MLRLALPLTATLMLGACARDSDDDGLTNGDEKDLGLDPKVGDSDKDGLNDGDEVSLGSDPLKADTDGDGLKDGEEVTDGCDPLVVDTDEDGYTDFDEVQTGHDPADPDDRIYHGHWPYYRDKDSISGKAAMSGEVEVGKRFGRYKAKDQFDEKVDLWDFYNEDKPVMMDVSAQWCGPCNEVAAWLDGADDAAFEAYNPIRDAVKAGDVYWVTVMLQDRSGNPATSATSKEWYQSYHSKEVPVLADTDYEVNSYVAAPYIPAFVLMKPDLTVEFYNPDNGYLALDKLLADLQDGQ